VRLTEHVTHMGTRELHIDFWLGNLKKIEYLEVISAHWKIILKWILIEIN
jgi:hypothetical protein